MRYWTHFKNGNKLYDAKRKKTFYAESIYRVNPENDKDISWACRIRECQNESGFAPRWWTTQIGFQTMSNGAARLTFVVSYADAMGFIGECLSAPDISVPGLVRNIQSDERFMCEVNDEPLLFEAMELYTGQGLTFKEQIYDKERGIPIILIMPKKDYIDKEKINLPIDPQKMIESVAENVLVYYSNELSFVDEMRYLMDEDYKCTAGMIRYYLPNIDISNPLDANRHRFIHYDEAMEKGEATILRIFRRVVAQDINDYDNLFRYRNCEELIRHDALESRFVQLKKKQEESSQIASTENDGLKSQLEEMELKNLEFEIENSDLKDGLQQAKNDNYGLQSQLDSIQAAYEPLKKGKEAYDLVRQIDEYPKTPKDILGFFVTVFSDRIPIKHKELPERCCRHGLRRGIMSIVKKIEIDGQMVAFKASAVIPRIYRLKFQRDIYKDLRSLEKSIGDGNEENSNLDLFSLEMFENISYVMAKHADGTIPDTPEEWLDGFNTFSIYQVLPELIELWGLNVQTDVEAKKTSCNRA